MSEEGKSRDTQELAAVRKRYERPSDQRSRSGPRWTAPTRRPVMGFVAGRVAELMERRSRKKPFFLAAGFRKPHSPGPQGGNTSTCTRPTRLVLPAEPACGSPGNRAADGTDGQPAAPLAVGSGRPLIKPDVSFMEHRRACCCGRWIS